MHTCHVDGLTLSLAQWLPAWLTAVTACMCTVNKRMNDRPSACVSPFAFHQFRMVQQYLRFFHLKLTAVHVDQLLLVNVQPFLLHLSLSLALLSSFFPRFSLHSFSLHSEWLFFYFISFPPSKLRETWIFECYQIWCLVRVSHYQGYKLPSLLDVYMLFLFALRLEHSEKWREKKIRNADRVFDLSKSCANKRHIASMQMFAQTFFPIDAQFKRQIERQSSTVLCSTRT